MADSTEGFIKHIDEFRRSKYRYLHISCHADETGLEINGDELSYKELSTILKPAIRNRRLFMSACKAANRELASRMIGENKALSVIGPPIDLYFDKSALFWPAFYHVINEIDDKKMSRTNIKATVQRCVDLFNVPINYYSRIGNSPGFMIRLKIRHSGRSENSKIKVLKYK